MQRPASANPLPSISAALRSAGSHLPSRKTGGKIGGIFLAVLVLLGAILVFTPIAHPRDTNIQGVTGSSSSRIETLLDEAARDQSTFHVKDSALMAAVTDYPEVASVEVHAHPPFRLDLDVVMRPAVARVHIGGRVFTVAGDGTILRRAPGTSVPTVDATISGLRLSADAVRGGGGALTVLAAAPEPLLALARGIRRGSAGLEVEMQRGPRLIFGTAEGARDKWAAAAAVIAEGAAAKASYIDLRVPGRPAVGGLGGSKTAGATATTEQAPPSLTAVAPQGDSTTGTGAIDTTASTGTGQAAAPAAATQTPSTVIQAPAQPAAQAGTQSQTPGGTSSAGDSAGATGTADPVSQPPAASSSGTGAATSGGGANLGGGATP